MQIKLDKFANDQEIAATRSVAASFGIDAEVVGGYQKPQSGLAEGIGDEPEWIILLVLGSTFGAFFTRFFAEAGADAWRNLKSLVETLRDTRRRPTGPEIPPSPPHQGAIHIRDVYGNEIHEGLYRKSPSNSFWKAWNQIGEPDWSQLSGWLAYWDAASNTWAALEPHPGTGHVYWDRSRLAWRERPRGYSEGTLEGLRHRLGWITRTWLRRR